MNLSTRRKLIQEVKDYDLNVNRRVADAQKRKILGISEQAEPYTQLNEQDIAKMQEITNILKQLLEKKLLTVNHFKEDVKTFSHDNKQILEISQIETIKTAYNNIISIYLNPRNTQETKTYIKRILISFENYIIDISNGIGDIIAYIRSENSGHLDALVRAYTLYEIILSQFAKGIFYKITDENIKHDFEINAKKYNKSNISARVRPQYFDIWDDDDNHAYQKEDEAKDTSAKEPVQSINDLHKKFEEDTTPHEAVKIPKLGPSMSTTSYFPFSSYQRPSLEESEPKKEETSISKMSFIVKPSDIVKKTGRIGMVALGKASSLLDEFRRNNNLPKLDIPPEKTKRTDSLYKFLQQYINFVDEDEKPYEELGSGLAKSKIIEQPTPLLQYNDVKNDPYFITK